MGWSSGLDIAESGFKGHSQLLASACSFPGMPRAKATKYPIHPMKTEDSTTPFALNLRAASFGLLLTVLTLLFGQGLGVAFGLNEDALKSRIKSDAAAVRETAYRGDDAAMKAVTDKSWAYLQRAHLHAGSMGTTALGLIILVCLLGISRQVAMGLSLALGTGGLGYSIYWLWAGFRAPGLGSTGAAKESLAWLAVPSSGIFVLATVVVLVVLAGSLLARRSSR